MAQDAGQLLTKCRQGVVGMQPRGASVRSGRRRVREQRLSAGRVVALFGVVSLALVCAVGFGALTVLRSRLVEHESESAASTVSFVARRVVEPALTPALLASDEPAITAFDRLVDQRVLRPDILHVKLWRADGTVVYSDVAELIGQRFALEPDQVEILRTGAGEEVHTGTLGRPEHEGLDIEGSVNEVYVGISGPGGEPMLWESYVARDRLVDRAEELLGFLTVTGVVSAGLVVSAQVGVAATLARSVERSQRERARLLRLLRRAADAERRRVASDLHDGVIQDLTGLALDLDPTVLDPTAIPAPEQASWGSPPEVDPREAAARVRQSLRDLRALAADLHPPDLAEGGFATALERLLAHAGDQLEVTLRVDGGLDLGINTARLLYRGAREAVRNVVRHADATRIELSLQRRGSRVVLAVTDDGRGFPADQVPNGEHLGLSLLGEMAEAAGGTLTLSSGPGAGTSVRLELPA